jgi:transposase
MRYELTDHEWAAIKPFLPNKPRGVPRVNDRRVLNGIFWVLRSGAPWRDLPGSFGPYTTCYNRFVRWRRAGVWGGIMNALAATHDATVQMIDTSIIRVHQHAACIIRFYAGYPLMLDDGSCIGTLCLLDTRPRTLEDSDLERLHDLADMVLREISGLTTR